MEIDLTLESDEELSLQQEQPGHGGKKLAGRADAPSGPSEHRVGPSQLKALQAQGVLSSGLTGRGLLPKIPNIDLGAPSDDDDEGKPGMHDQGEDDDEFLSLGGLGGIATTGMGPGKVLDPPLKAPPKKRAKTMKHPVLANPDADEGNSDGETAAGALSQAGKAKRTREQVQADAAAKRLQKEQEKASKADARAAAKQAKEEEKAKAAAEKAAGKSIAGAVSTGAASQLKHLRLVVGERMASHAFYTHLCSHLELREERTRIQSLQRPLPVESSPALRSRNALLATWLHRVPKAAEAAVTSCQMFNGMPCTNTGDGYVEVDYPCVMVVLEGASFIEEVLSDPGRPLYSIALGVRTHNPRATLFVTVMGLESALKARTQSDRAFSRSTVHDAIADLTIACPAIRLRTDLEKPNDAAAHLENLTWALSGQAKRQAEGYLKHFSEKDTEAARRCRSLTSSAPVACFASALSQLVAPPRALAIAARFKSVAALIKELQELPTASARERLMVGLPAEGPTGRNMRTGPAAAKKVVSFFMALRGDQEVEEGEAAEGRGMAK